MYAVGVFGRCAELRRGYFLYCWCVIRPHWGEIEGW